MKRYIPSALILALATVGVLFSPSHDVVLAQQGPPGCLDCIHDAIVANAECVQERESRQVCAARVCEAFLACVESTQCDLGTVMVPPFCTER